MGHTNKCLCRNVVDVQETEDDFGDTLGEEGGPVPRWCRRLSGREGRRQGGLSLLGTTGVLLV